MLIVVIINLALALILVYVAWRVWQLRSQLAEVADILSTYEQSIHTGLSSAPEAIATVQISIQQLKQRSLLQDLQLFRLQQVLALVGVGQQIWQQSRLVRRSKLLRKALASKYRLR